MDHEHSSCKFNIKSHQVSKRLPHGVGISRKSMVSFEGLWTHRPLKLTINFLEMPTPMGESLCHLVRLDLENFKSLRAAASTIYS